MSSINIIKQSKIDLSSFRVKSIIDRYELNPDCSKFIYNAEIDYNDKDWHVGLIVGSSGSGKSTIAKTLFSDEYIHGFDYNDKAVIDNMNESKDIEEITRVFNSVGFGTAWNWIKPYDVLSQGEKMRVDIAKAILEDKELFVFDEFTSVVDRQVAKIASSAISKAIKRTNKKFVAVSCHKDIIDWLEPDWIFNTDENAFFLPKNRDQKSSLSLGELTKAHGIDLGSIII